MNLKRLQLSITLLLFLLLIHTIGCKKDDSALKEQIAQLTIRISVIEDQLTQINSSVITLQQAGKLNTDETAALKNLTANLSVTINDLKSSSGTTTKDINDLKIALQQCATTLQLDEVKATIGELLQLVNSTSTNLSNETTKNSELAASLQLQVTQLAKDLNNLTNTESTQELAGKIEKGGFAKGSLINFFEMDSNLTQTGRSFNATITDNFGSFDITVKNLKGKICRVVTDGFFFNEVSGKNSSSRITLTGLVKIDSSETLNINVLTHMERPRVEYLIKNGLSFTQAKAQAVTEVLASFGIANPGITRSEKINLIGTAKKNNILLTISTLLVGYRSESQLTELLTDISEDLKVDGIMNDVSIGNDIETHLYYLDTLAVTNHVKEKYASAYADSIITKLNYSYIKTFQTNTNFSKAYSLIDYPTGNTTAYRYPNILFSENSISSAFEVAANIKSNNLSLRIEINIEDDISLDSYRIAESIGTNVNWEVTIVSRTKAILTTKTTGLSTILLGLGSIPRPSGRIIVRYFEGSSLTPTKTKTLSYQ